MDYKEVANYFISLLVICSPFSALPTLIILTHDRSMEEKKQIGIKSGIAVAVILTIVTWVGSPLLDVLGITVPAFQFAGGFIIFLLALSMLNAQTSRMKQTTEDQKEAKHKESIAIVPLAIPLMAGPGAISTVVVYVNSNPGFFNALYLNACALVVALVLGVTLYFAAHLEKVLGHTGINIVNRIGGIILAAMAVQTMSRGMLGLFPYLGQAG